jgi:hypothetical protein
VFGNFPLPGQKEEVEIEKWRGKLLFSLIEFLVENRDEECNVCRLIGRQYKGCSVGMDYIKKGAFFDRFRGIKSYYRLS